MQFSIILLNYYEFNSKEAIYIRFSIIFKVNLVSFSADNFQTVKYLKNIAVF